MLSFIFVLGYFLVQNLCLKLDGNRCLVLTIKYCGLSCWTLKINIKVSDPSVSESLFTIVSF